MKVRPHLLGYETKSLPVCYPLDLHHLDLKSMNHVTSFLIASSCDRRAFTDSSILLIRTSLSQTQTQLQPLIQPASPNHCWLLLTLQRRCMASRNASCPSFNISTRLLSVSRRRETSSLSAATEAIFSSLQPITVTGDKIFGRGLIKLRSITCLATTPTKYLRSS